MKIREVDLFDIDKINIKVLPWLIELDFGNNDHCFFAIKSFGKIKIIYRKTLLITPGVV